MRFDYHNVLHFLSKGSADFSQDGLGSRPRRERDDLPVPDTGAPPKVSTRIRNHLSRVNRIKPLSSNDLVVGKDNHHFSGFNQGRCDLTFLEPQFAHCIGGND